MKIEILADDEISEIVYDERNRCGELLRHYNKLLSAGEVVYQDRLFPGWRTSQGSYTQQKALIINIEEIKPDSFEDVVRDYIRCAESDVEANVYDIRDRMIKLLGDKK